jgi:hypothetical protein
MPLETASAKLESWKEIAAFIGRDVRTAMRWAQQGMPVHRVPGAKRGRIFAYSSEIDAWLNGHASGEPPSDDGDEAAARSEGDRPAEVPRVVRPAMGSSSRRALKLLVAAGTFVVLAVLAKAIATRPAVRTVSHIGFLPNAVAGVDSEGHQVWKHQYPADIDPDVPAVARFEDLVRTVDLFGDGKRETLLMVAYRLGPNPQDPFQTEVDCFAPEGKLLWSYVPAESFRFGSHVIQQEWKVSDIFVSTQGLHPRVWVAVFHGLWGNSFVAELDTRTGKPALRFVNTGIIHKLNEMSVEGRPYLIAAGFNNEHDSGAVALLDESQAFAVSPQTPGTRHFCDSCAAAAPGSPEYYFVFPRSEINRLKRVYEDQVDQLDVHGSELQATKKELHLSSGVTAVYVLRFDGGPKPVSLRFDSTYDMLHGELERGGALKHRLANCPERLHPEPVRVWTSATEWKEMSFPAATAWQ